MGPKLVYDLVVDPHSHGRASSFIGFEFGVRNPIKNTNITTMERNLAIIIDKLPVPEEFGSPEFLASLVAGNFDDLVRTKMDNIRVWFNNKGWTSSVGYLNAVNNLVLRA